MPSASVSPTLPKQENTCELDVWVAGTSGGFMTSTGEVSHWDGRSWTRVLERTDVDLSDLTAFSRRDVWAVGASDDGTLPLLLHWDGRSWTASSRKPQSGYDEAWLLSVAGASPTDVWAGGGQHQEELSPPAIAPFMVHWDGKSWTSSRFGLAGETEFRGIAPASSHEAWAVSANSWSYELQGGGAFQSWRRTGNRWRAIDLPRGLELMDIASVPGRPASAPVLWAVGQRGTRITDYATRTRPLIPRYGC